MIRILRLSLALTAVLVAGSLLAQTASKGPDHTARHAVNRSGAPATPAASAPAPAPAAPAPAAAKADDDVEEVEDVQAVEVATPAAAEADANRGGWQDIGGRLHNAVVHGPIGWLTMVLLLDVLAFAFRRRDLEPAGLWALGGTLLTFVPAIATGLMREDFVSPLPAVHALIETHEALVFATAGTAAAAFLWRLGFRKRFAGAPKAVYLALISAAVALVVVAGHWGGKIAWGEEYLPF